MYNSMCSGGVLRSGKTAHLVRKVSCMKNHGMNIFSIYKNFIFMNEMKRNDIEIPIHEIDISLHENDIFMHENDISMHEYDISMNENDIFMHENDIFMHENDIFMHENDVSKHENETFALKIFMDENSIHEIILSPISH